MKAKKATRLGKLGRALALALAVGACESGECEEGGRTYQDGDNWKCSDGCNACVCNDGVLSKTAALCDPEGSGGEAR
jgi:hypothetical protein